VYRRPDGSVITDASERAWIDAIRIPPGWTDVWISPTPDGHILATGRDSRGRKQYIYHPGWRGVRDQTKYHRVGSFGRALPGLRRQIERDLDLPGLPREKVLGAVIRLMDLTLIRIGNEEYVRQNQHYGLTTLRHDHVRFQDETTVMFEFRAKSGKEQRVMLSDPCLADIVHACHELPGQELFQYVDNDGRIVDVGSAEVNAYLRATTRAIFSQGLPYLGRHRDHRRSPGQARATPVGDGRQTQDQRCDRRGRAAAQQHPGGVPQELRRPSRARVLSRRIAGGDLHPDEETPTAVARGVGGPSSRPGTVTVTGWGVLVHDRAL